MAYAPTLVPKIDMAPVPRVEVTFETMHASAETANVYRITDDRTYRVRDGIDRRASGGFALVDFECGFQVPSSYRAEMFDASAVSLGFTDVSVTELDFDGTVLHQPIDPTRAVVVSVMKGTGSKLSRPMKGAMVEVEGREIPVWIGAGRAALRGVPLQFMTNTSDDARALESIFGLYGEAKQVPVVCVRSSLELGLPKPFFALIQDPQKVPIDATIGGQRASWPWTADEASPPAGALVTPLLTYGDLEASYATYSALEGAYLTYLAAESDWSLAGSA